MKPLLRFAMLSLVLVVVALVSALTAMRFAIHGQEVQVPALVGQTPLDAERSVTGMGLQIVVERQYYSAQIPEGRIVSQLPLAGTKVRRGWEVRVAESMGPQRVSIPDVTGESERAAELNIRRRGLELASTAQIPTPNVPEGQVLAQSPPASASQVTAPKTSLLVTAVADPPSYVMPSFVGQPLGNASRIVQDAGFKLGTVTMASTAANAVANAAPAAAQAGSLSTAPAQPSPASVIVAQTPQGGKKVTLGATVNFEVK